MPPRGPELPLRQVESDLRRRCRAGKWEPREQLPAVAELAQHYGVARNTVMKALRRLAEDGLVGDRPSEQPKVDRSILSLTTQCL